MKREIIAAVLTALCLSGCANSGDPYRVDTVVYIPADPTQSQEETEISLATEVPETSEMFSTESEETETVPETVPETTETEKTTGSSKKNTSGKKTTSSSKKNTSTKETEPAATKPAATEPPVTEEPAAHPTVTEPTETEPAETEVPATEAEEPTAAPLYDISGYSIGSLEYAMKDAINAYRTAAGLGELSLNARLCAIASFRGYEISQVWSHTRPDGRNYSTVLEDYGYGGWAQELLVYAPGSGDGQAIVDKWMESDSHKELLLGGYSTIGIGVYRVGGNAYIACFLI